MSFIDARVRLPQEFRQNNQYGAFDTGQYDKILGLSEKMNQGTLQNLLDSMERNSISFAIMHAETEGGESADFLNSALAKVVSENKNKFLGVGTVDLQTYSPATMLRQLNESKDYGFKGISIQPAFFGLDIHDRILYPLYAKAEEIGQAVAIHTGVTYSRKHPIAHEKPEYLDQVACDFPDLRLIASHSGWPWASEMAAVASRHPTVYLEFGAIAPKYISKPGTGWDAIFALMPNRLKSQILFGSDWPVLQQDRVIAEWENSGLDQSTLTALLHDNSAALFGLK